MQRSHPEFVELVSKRLRKFRVYSQAESRFFPELCADTSDFDVIAFAIGNGGIRFAFICRGCSARALVLFFREEDPSLLRCRRCLRLGYESPGALVRRVERLHGHVFGERPRSTTGGGGEPGYEPRGTPVGPIRDLKGRVVPGTEPPSQAPTQGAASAAVPTYPNLKVKFDGPARSLAEVRRRFEAVFGPLTETPSSGAVSR